MKFKYWTNEQAGTVPHSDEGEIGLTLKKNVELKGEGNNREIDLTCPFCENDFKINIDITEGVHFKTNCPNCDQELEGRTNDKIWRCSFCKSDFDTKKQTTDHEKTCSKT